MNALPQTQSGSSITPPGLTLGLSLSFIPPLVQSSSCSSWPCSLPKHIDQSLVSWSSMTAFKAVPALLFKTWNIHLVHTRERVQWIGSVWLKVTTYGDTGVHIYKEVGRKQSSVVVKIPFSHTALETSVLVYDLLHNYSLCFTLRSRFKLLLNSFNKVATTAAGKFLRTDFATLKYPFSFRIFVNCCDSFWLSFFIFVHAFFALGKCPFKPWLLCAKYCTATSSLDNKERHIIHLPITVTFQDSTPSTPSDNWVPPKVKLLFFTL